jgi:Ring finger domain
MHAPAEGHPAQVEQGAAPADAEVQEGPDEGTCCICLDTIDEMTMTICGHQFCTECITECVERTSRCPQCRTR